MNLEYKKLELSHIDLIVSAFLKADWPKPYSTFQTYYEEQQKGKRDIWVAFNEQQIAGYVTLKWYSDYKIFQEQNIPEIKDLNVLPQHRSQGIGTKLLILAEERVAQTNLREVGIGVGLDKTYGSAQKLYVKMGYIPDGNGLTYNGEVVEYGENILVDDDLNLWLTKRLI